MYEGPSPLPDGISLNILANTSGEGPTHLKVMSKVKIWPIGKQI